MNIGLLDIDGHNFPNLALMKISAWHKNKNDKVEFANIFNDYDIIYKSKVFTFTEDDNICYNTKKIIKGGSGYKIYNRLQDKIEHICPDYELYNCKHAYGFLTRGCIRKCSFCIVPKKEGNIKSNADIKEFISDKKSAILLDNNVLASEHGLKQIEKIIKLKIKVDFNQGLDCRIIAKNIDIAKLLSNVKWLKPLRMSLDSDSQIDSLIKAIEFLRYYKTTPKNYFIYILTKDINNALKRVNICKKYNLDPYVQPYMDPEKDIKLSWEIKNFLRYVNRKAIFKSVSWTEYKNYRQTRKYKNENNLYFNY